MVIGVCLGTCISLLFFKTLVQKHRLPLRINQRLSVGIESLTSETYDSFTECIRVFKPFTNQVIIFILRTVRVFFFVAHPSCATSLYAPPYMRTYIFPLNLLPQELTPVDRRDSMDRQKQECPWHTKPAISFRNILSLPIGSHICRQCCPYLLSSMQAVS